MLHLLMHMARSLPRPLTTLSALFAACLSMAFVHDVLDFPVSTSILIAIVVAIAAVRWRGPESPAAPSPPKR
jgi:hypothetical protein